MNKITGTKQKSETVFKFLTPSMEKTVNLHGLK